MSEFSFQPLVFWFLAALTVLSAAGVAFSSSIVYSAFALMGTLLGAAGLFVLLAADFVAVVQVLIYVGGVLVLTLFAVMLTHRVGDVRISNRAVGRLPSLVIVGAVGAVMARAVFTTRWHQVVPGAAEPTTYGIGDSFLRQFILPFELASLVLLAALIGADPAEIVFTSSDSARTRRSAAALADASPSAYKATTNFRRPHTNKRALRSKARLRSHSENHRYLA